MGKKSLFLTILLWLEVIVCLRILLFVLPLWMNQYLTGNFGVMKLNDWFMVVLTLAVFLHGLAALLWLRNFPSGKVFHYLGLAVVFMMTGGLFILSYNVTGSFERHYVYPLVGSFIMVTALSVVGHKVSSSQHRKV